MIYKKYQIFFYVYTHQTIQKTSKGEVSFYDYFSQKTKIWKRSHFRTSLRPQIGAKCVPSSFFFLNENEKEKKIE